MQVTNSYAVIDASTSTHIIVLLDPLLYDALVRQFQSASERQEEAKTKGYSRVLEGDLMRGEAKFAETAEMMETAETANNHQDLEEEDDNSPTATTQAKISAPFHLDPPHSKVEAMERWNEFLQDRFIHGEDDEFEYGPIDKDDQFDVLEQRDQEEEWFNDEEPSWVSDGSGQSSGKRERMLDGETGVQDF